ncbi:MAG: 7-carboxy-7-deazaguanine synthase QueE [Chitinophagales bacterium]|nr:7-carboxy-7-deazaguanine synthase QueE [Chitinophagales bacterium]MDW8274271.1 7-carboxy-7-deazaguanine synthase QueE [Chitinophagales bacterium]
MQQTNHLPAGQLPLMEHFFTIQGEGFHSGKPAYFLRLGGCDVGCVWCDVKESWDANAHPLTPVENMLESVLASKADTCVITGGEPLMYELTTLTKLLRDNKIRVHLETSGAYSLTGTWDWITVSPKRFKLPLKENLKAANELKVVIYHPNDLRWAEQFVPQTSEQCLFFLQPEWSRFNEIIPEIIAYVKQNPHWRISLQIHKFMNIP